MELLLNSWLVSVGLVVVGSVFTGFAKERFRLYYNAFRRKTEFDSTGAIFSSLAKASLLLAFHIALTGAILALPIWGVRALL